MKKCISGRQTGKTKKLIELSAEKQIPILTTSISNVKNIKLRAEEMRLSIPDPISVTEILSDRYLNNISTIENIIVDDTEYVLKKLLYCRKVRNVEAISITTDDMDDELI